MITEKVYMETQLETLTTFGVRLDTGEQVFIPSKIVKKHNILEAQTWELVILPNAHSSDSTPWRAVGVSIVNTPEQDSLPWEVDPTPRVQLAKLEDRIIGHFEVETNEFPHTAPALAAALGAGDLHMQHTLGRMHNTGEVAKAQVFAKGTQDKASVVLWAPDISWFYV
jgi:hypothetical protein|tara:strand:- start:485 stop:988 length:504 start_codon:yes stop_codon:yes gene_type:complete